MKKKLLEEIEKLHKNNNHEKIIQIIYSINENERDYHIISLLARALNNIQISNSMYMLLKLDYLQDILPEG